MEQCRQGKSAKWIRNFGKRIGSEGWARGSQSRIHRLSADCLSCTRGESGPPRAGWGTDLERLSWGPSPGVEQPTQNWYVKKLVVGPWVGSVGPPHGVHRPPRPLCRRCVPGLNWPGRASGAVTLKKLECSKQAHALDTLAWDNTTGFRSYCVGLRDRSND
ncbi:hypothetical protein M5K25_009011 [Dendrobium thyrsiflorum]|uniref:Uncharacterized protein n=1 Tax=Dendrobium thyrsiflorum TaxID=117978 RepID=A0ABD0V4U2_DENTH